MPRVFNFNAGPAMLPEEVMLQAQQELMDWNGCGMSMMEISHRSPEFLQLAEESKRDLRKILEIPSNYHILFLHGGARSQYSMVPMNLLGKKKKTAYAQTGIWGKMAAEEAELYSQVELIINTENKRFTTIPSQDQWQKPSEDAAYLHYVDNETINGVEFPQVPESYGLPLVVDMSSNILSRPFDIRKFGLVYACAQKNLGPAGITLVIIRDDLLQNEPLPMTPSMFRYQLHVENDSLLNTAPTYPWYISGLIFKWMLRQGGLTAIAARNQRKAQKLYNYIDQSNFYSNPVDPTVRSRMNVIFTLPNEKMDAPFLAKATKAGLVGLKGHRYLGGMRASIYNAMPEEGVDALLEFMDDFARS